MKAARIPDEIVTPDGDALYPVRCGNGDLAWCTRDEVLGLRSQGFSAGCNTDKLFREDDIWRAQRRAHYDQMSEWLRRGGIRMPR